MKGIILAGGKATRLYPLTKMITKQLLPIYDKPMIYYPLANLMLAGITEIAIISTKRDMPFIHELLGDGSNLGVSLTYIEQASPNGIAESFILAENFIGDDNVCLILGDNIFYGHELADKLNEAAKIKDGGIVFAYHVRDPERYGVVEFDNNYNAIDIVEKPKNPKSSWAVTGIYFYDNKVIDIAKSLKPSARGELEITDVNKTYLLQQKLKVQLLGRGVAWLDTGTVDSLIEASDFVRTLQNRQGLKIACIEEVAYHKGYIDKHKLNTIANLHGNNSEYGKYLLEIASHEEDLWTKK